MQRRTFYVVNLDIKRIIFLFMFLIATVSSFFTLGLSLGKRSTQNYAQNIELSRSEQNSNAVVEVDSQILEDNLSPNLNEPLVTQTSEPKIEITSQNEEVTTPPTNIEVINLNPDSSQNQSPEASERIADTKPASIQQPDLTDYFTIQLAAFTSEEGAKKLKTDIEKSNKVEVYIERNNKGYYLVRVGREKTRSSINRILRNLKSGYKKTAIILKV